jgi:SagB-type dehydrogenase family enzyme
MDRIRANREFMKSVFGTLAVGASDQSKGVPEPPLELPHPAEAESIALPKPDRALLSKNDLYECIESRQSRRRWTKEPLPLEELAFLLWATQGVKEVLGGGYAALRTVPSGGARHAFETYLVIQRVEGVLPGLYRYLPLSHSLVFLAAPPDLREHVLEATFGQRFVAEAPVVFFWSCIPYRAEWRYTIAAHKVMLLDAGHVCQNLYLACEAIGAGTCAIGAYDQQAADRLLGLDGQDEFVVYLAPVGKPPHA